MAYSPDRKAAVLTKNLPPNNMPLVQLAKEEGISKATLAKWRAEARAKRQFLPDAKAGPEGWASRDKLWADTGVAVPPGVTGAVQILGADGVTVQAKF